MVGEKAGVLEPFLLLAKTARGSAISELIRQVTEAPNIFVFGELLDSPSIKELESSGNVAGLDTLKVFAYGTYKQYKEMKLPELSPPQTKKLRQLTIATIASQQKSIPYDVLKRELDISSVRELEGLIIDCIYCGLIEGRLDQKHSRVEVDCVVGRDVSLPAVDSVIDKLSSWCNNCENVMKNIEAEAIRANAEKEIFQTHRSSIESEINNIRKTVKTGSAEREDVLMEEGGIRDTGDKARRVPHQRKTPRRLLSKDAHKD